MVGWVKEQEEKQFAGGQSLYPKGGNVGEHCNYETQLPGQHAPCEVKKQLQGEQEGSMAGPNFSFFETSGLKSNIDVFKE